ncbi:MAG: DegT/DnrJ/EryC1/StrS family aminotransferase [Sedimentisphaerales bacterium]|nr:DegT/DnrJ/EryC1/StrS family aminotransferase [Sedimentisphaerales bacterium]
MSKEGRNEVHTTGEESEGGITSSYETGDGVELKVKYSFFGSIYDEDEKNAVLEAMEQDSLTMGLKVQIFQEDFAKFHDVKHAFAVSNCTTGMHLCTQLFDLKEGDEVIITPNTFIANSLVLLKEKVAPVYADIDPRTFNIDPAEIAKKVTSKTKAIYVVHYAGQMCDMDPIMEIARKHNIFVLEDCAHAHGATYKGKKAGSVGDAGVFSFHSLKNITTCGEGGMITTNNDEWVKPIEALRCMNLGQWDIGQTEFTFGRNSLKKVIDGKYSDYWVPSHFDVQDYKGHWGNNYRMNEIQAAVGIAQVKKIDMLTEKRRYNARYINDGIKDIDGVNGVYEDPNCGHVFHLYTLTLDPEVYDRDGFLRVLYREFGVQGILHYQPTYHFTGLQKLGITGDCPIAEKFFYKRELNLPMHPRLTKQELDDVVAGIKGTAEKLRK